MTLFVTPPKSLEAPRPWIYVHIFKDPPGWFWDWRVGSYIFGPKNPFFVKFCHATRNFYWRFAPTWNAGIQYFPQNSFPRFPPPAELVSLIVRTPSLSHSLFLCLSRSPSLPLVICSFSFGSIHKIFPQRWSFIFWVRFQGFQRVPYLGSSTWGVRDENRSEEVYHLPPTRCNKCYSVDTTCHIFPTSVQRGKYDLTPLFLFGKRFRIRLFSKYCKQPWW